MQPVKIKYTDHSRGEVDFELRDRLGRAVGYRWVIRIAKATLRSPEELSGYVLPDDLPLDYFDVWTTPTRNGKPYGPSFSNARVATLAEAEAVVAKRIKASRKSYIKKFGELKP